MSNNKEEIERINQRKKEPLTLQEWLLFFFIPFKLDRSQYNFHTIEARRFRENNFDRKLKQMGIARFLGILFYLASIRLFGHVLTYLIY